MTTETEGSESDTPMDECNSIDSTDERYFQPPSEDSEYSNTRSESLLTPREVSNVCNIPGINVSVNKVDVDINQMVENCVISNNMIDEDTDDDQVENIENTAMGINVNSNVNVDVNSCEKAVMGKNISTINVSLAQDTMLSVGEANSVMGINSDLTTNRSPYVIDEMGKNIKKMTVLTTLSTPRWA